MTMKKIYIIIFFCLFSLALYLNNSAANELLSYTSYENFIKQIQRINIDILRIGDEYVAYSLEINQKGRVYFLGKPVKLKDKKRGFGKQSVRLPLKDLIILTKLLQREAEPIIEEIRKETLESMKKTNFLQF